MTIALQYATSDPAVPIDPTTLVLNVKLAGADWSHRFTVTSRGDSAAQFDLAANDALVGGKLEVTARVADVSGGTVAASVAVNVVPTFAAITPPAGRHTDHLSIAAQALDPIASHNVVLFPSALSSTAVVAVPLEQVEVESGVGTLDVPLQIGTGTVRLAVNGVTAEETRQFEVTEPLPRCGKLERWRYLPNGGAFVFYDESIGSVAAGCPQVRLPVPEPVYTPTYSAYISPDSHVYVLRPQFVDSRRPPRFPGTYLEQIAVSKDGRTLATIVWNERDDTISVHYGRLPKDGGTNDPPTVLGTTKLVLPAGYDYVGGADFDKEGNLFLAVGDGSYYHSHWFLARVPAVAEDAGAPALVTPTTVASLDDGPTFWGVSSVDLPCDGDALLGMGYIDPSTQLNAIRMRRIDLANGAVLADSEYLAGAGGSEGDQNLTIVNATLSCHTDDLWVLVDHYDYEALHRFHLGTDPKTIDQHQAPPGWRVEQGRGDRSLALRGNGDLEVSIPLSVGSVPVVQLEPCAPMASAASVSVGPNDQASCLLQTPDRTTAPTTAACTGGLAMLPYCMLQLPPPSGISISPSTDRWKAQRDATSPSGDIAIKFTSTVPLQSATVSFTGPSSVAPITQTFDPKNPPNPYVITWPGTARLTDPKNPTSYLNAGDYTVAITGTPEQGQPISTAANDPNAKVSLVKIEAIELTDFRDSKVTANPGPDASFPGVGLRVFAEAREPLVDAATPPPVYDTVKVTARVVPPVPLVEGQPTITVTFQAIDADDPYVGGRIDDEGKPTDNRGDAIAGFIPVSAFSSTDPVPAPIPIGSVFGVDAPRQPPAGTSSMTVEVALRVSHRDGDNYRVLASLDASSLGQRVSAQQKTPKTVDNTRYPAGWVDRDGAPLPVSLERVEVSNLLTVWRTLHLEVDRLVSQDPDADQRRLDVQGDWAVLEGSKLEAKPTAEDPKPFEDEKEDVKRLDSWVLHDGLNPWLGADLTVGFHSGDVYEVTGNGDKKVDVRIGNNQPPLTNNLSEADLAKLSDKSFILRDDPLESLQKQADYSYAEEILRRLYIAIEPMTQGTGETEVPFVISQYWEFDQAKGDPAKRLDTHNIVHDANYSLASQGWSSQDYWSVQLVSAFDGDPKSDFDPREEWDWHTRSETSSGNLGVTTWGSCTVQTASGPALRGRCKPHASIFMETLSDFIRRTPRGFDPPGEDVLNRRATAHELLHALRVEHGNALMCANVMMRRGDRGQCVTESQMETIRNLIQPQLSESRDRQCTQDGSDSCWRLQP